jgi:hypothetical protein
MTTLRRFRLWTLALVVGAVSQAPAHDGERLPTATSGCPAELVDLLRVEVPTNGGAVICRRSAGNGDAPSVRVSLRASNPHVGEPCEDVHYQRVDFILSSDGDVTAKFPVFGGLSVGTLSLSPEQAKMIETWDGYVADAQLGSYEPAAQRGGPVCHLNRTYHFYCPATHTLDQLCITWLPRSQDVLGPSALQIRSNG